jgi:pimeloyl-ACP methyl ester carboxylesterase
VAAPGAAPAAATGSASALRNISSGLPSVPSGHRPGPDILYANPPTAPQLENTGVWKGPPILVSGAQAYRDGEWLYQDYLFDDHGATGVPDPNTPYGASTNLFSPPAGTFTYPTDQKLYADNAADLVEFRIKPLQNATAFRITLNTLIDPSRVAVTIALDDSPSSVAWPDGAGVSSPAKYFLTWHGRSADFQDAATGKVMTPAPTVGVDMLRRQIQLVVPHSTWDPGLSTVRTTIGVGLWDPKAGTYLAPQPGQATATTPGGGTPNGVAIVNVGPRLNEPMPIFAGTNFVDSAALGEVNARFWRERQQSEQLALGDVSPFFTNVDFSKLAAGVTDDSGVPTTGPIDRIFASHFSSGQGVQPQNVCFDLGRNFALGAKCIGREVGQLQPYALYVPNKPEPPQGWGLTLLLHSLSVNYNQYLNSRMQSELGNRGPGSIVLTTEGRGPDGFYAGVPEADTFEAWADVARHYPLDPSWADVSGYSMGGFGTYRLLARWPDLFAKGFSVVGAPGTVGDQLISIRNDPLLLWNATADELVNLNTSEQAVQADENAGLQFQENLFLNADHLTLAANDEYTPGADFLGTATVNRDPARVSYVGDPTEDSTAVVADHAYWISGLQPRGKGDATVDVFSEGFGQGIPPVEPVQEGAGALTGGEIPALAYVSRTQAWGPAPAAPARDELVITAKNLATMTIDVARARVTCGVKLDVQTDGPLAITLGGCGRTLRFG